MIKTMKSEEVRSQWRDVLDDVSANRAEVVVERYSKPTAAIVSYAQWQAYKRQRKERHDQILREMDAGNYQTWEEVKAALTAEGILS